MRYSKLAMSLLTALAATACGSAQEFDPVDESPSDDGMAIEASSSPGLHESAPMSEEVLQRVSAGGTTLTFLRYAADDGATQLMMREDASAYARESLIDRLEGEVGPLTLLELFHAFAPESEVAHEALIAQHAVEIVALGRESTEVLRVRGDVALTVEKSVTLCEDWVYQPRTESCFGGWTNRGKRTDVTGSQGVCLNDNCGLYTAFPNTAGACSESNHSVNVLVQLGNTNNNNGEWFTTASGTVAAFQRTRWRPATAGVGATQRLWIAGNSSGTYHLRTGTSAIDRSCIPR